ncbi:hypothetical protein NQD34_009768 [Periophthalmus magnuspinnatus]|nr:hypothetical protein NQD34_009768 [Periophthalmus magnuspinnatus]
MELPLSKRGKWGIVVILIVGVLVAFAILLWEANQKHVQTNVEKILLKLDPRSISECDKYVKMTIQDTKGPSLAFQFDLCSVVYCKTPNALLKKGLSPPVLTI